MWASPAFAVADRFIARHRAMILRIAAASGVICLS